MIQPITENSKLLFSHFTDKDKKNLNSVQMYINRFMYGKLFQSNGNI